ncbi:hypothetical protein BLNAU_1638 [Blattamonas nauphoetae]|uniref:Dihydrofolate reductase n=1 Tax=Blattamonas nauphoetae TaxID=2049346 RepID=A0ABQ9YIK5_9EUKA|nr:hypothetical protein BLNAU_1638 [Blattamonas nauphoetae]
MSITKRVPTLTTTVSNLPDCSVNAVITLSEFVVECEPNSIFILGEGIFKLAFKHANAAYQQFVFLLMPLIVVQRARTDKGDSSDFDFNKPFALVVDYNYNTQCQVQDANNRFAYSIFEKYTTPSCGGGV